RGAVLRTPRDPPPGAREDRPGVGRPIERRFRSAESFGRHAATDPEWPHCVDQRLADTQTSDVNGPVEGRPHVVVVGFQELYRYELGLPYTRANLAREGDEVFRVAAARE